MRHAHGESDDLLGPRGSRVRISVNHFLAAPSIVGLRSLERSCSSREGAPEDVAGFLRLVRVLSQRPSASHQRAGLGHRKARRCWMSLRSLTTCSYVSDATSAAMRHCTIVVTPLPMSAEPYSFRPREIHHRPHASCLGNEKKSPCRSRWWLVVDRWM